MSLSDVNAEGNSKETIASEDNEKKPMYSSYLKTIGFVSLVTVVIELFLFIAHLINNELNSIQICIAVISIVFLFLALSAGFLIPDEDFLKACRHQLDKLINGKTVTVLFVTHIICSSLFIFQDGGVQSSCVSNILLLDASFGCIFANEKHMKVIVTLSCLGLYVLTYLYNTESTDIIPNVTYAIVPYLLTVLFILLCNVIINQYSVEKARDNK